MRGALFSPSLGRHRLRKAPNRLDSGFARLLALHGMGRETCRLVALTSARWVFRAVMTYGGGELVCSVIS